MEYSSVICLSWKFYLRKMACVFVIFFSILSYSLLLFRSFRVLFHANFPCFPNGIFVGHGILVKENKCYAVEWIEMEWNEYFMGDVSYLSGAFVQLVGGWWMINIGRYSHANIPLLVEQCVSLARWRIAMHIHDDSPTSTHERTIVILQRITPNDWLIWSILPAYRFQWVSFSGII